ncbi:MAG: GNAT family N-acetyltransferase [Chloroflexota bacterium]|nr:GNAT family N-acetyltransferase [Chloroflexota bacterium]
MVQPIPRLRAYSVRRNRGASPARLPPAPMLINWIQFTWDLNALPLRQPELPEHYQISRAMPEDEPELRKVISSSFSLDPAWNASMQEIAGAIDSWLERAAAPEGNTVCLALRHGLRIIGATVLTLADEAENHLAPGPCILVEYRNRGYGTRLLEASLRTLQEAGLHVARGIAQEHSPATKFLYPKFNSTLSNLEVSPLVAA